MENYQLSDSEKVIYESKKEDFVITDKRMRKIDYSGKRRPFTSILLRNITSIRVNYENHIEYLIYSALFAMFLLLTLPVEMINQQLDIFIYLIFIVLVSWFIVKYFSTRIHQVEFRSSSGKIVITEKAIPFKDWDKIISDVEMAMLDFKKINSL